MKHKQTEIVSNVRIARDLYEMRFGWDPGAGAPLPGQFITIRVNDGTSPLLRRPFALSGYDTAEETAAIIYKKIGKSTQILTGKTQEDTLDWIGPLGNGFEMPAPGSIPILAGGGTGLGPILYFCAHLRQHNFQPVFIFGCQTREFVPRYPVFQAENPQITTDDGSEGLAGTVIDQLKQLPDTTFSNAILYCCGPTPMLRACHELAVEQQIPCYVSIEQVMACGVGACMGCVVKLNTSPGLVRACKEGPVFDSRTMLWT